QAPHPESVRVSEVLGALSFALDLTEGHPMGHALRTCLIGVEIAKRLGLSLQDERDLYYALLLKDVGCSSGSARAFELVVRNAPMPPQVAGRVDWGNYFKATRFGLAYSARGASWFQRALGISQIAQAGSNVANELVKTRSERGAEMVARLGFGARVADAVR